MFTRFRISQVVEGVEVVSGEPTIENSNHAKDAELPQTNVSAWFPVSLVDGSPLFNWAFCLTSTAFPAQLALLQGYTFPDFPLDGQLGAMEEAVRLALFQSVAAFDLDGQGNYLDVPSYDSGMSYGQFLNHIGQQFDSGFSVNTATVVQA